MENQIWLHLKSNKYAPMTQTTCHSITKIIIGMFQFQFQGGMPNTEVF